MNQIKKATKNDTLPPVRVGQETKEKFKARCKKIGRSPSSVIREFVENGRVEVIYNGKELMRYVAEVHKKINQYSLKMSSDIQAIERDVRQINSCLQNQGMKNELLRVYLARALIRLDNFQNQYNDRIAVCERILPVRDGNHGNI
ncbi:MAG: hypothetical protein ABFC57_04415 [Veillonellales bacterium]